MNVIEIKSKNEARRKACYELVFDLLAKRFDSVHPVDFDGVCGKSTEITYNGNTYTLLYTCEQTESGWCTRIAKEYFIDITVNVGYSRNYTTKSIRAQRRITFNADGLEPTWKPDDLIERLIKCLGVVDIIRVEIDQRNAEVEANRLTDSIARECINDFKPCLLTFKPVHGEPLINIQGKVTLEQAKLISELLSSVK